MKILIKYFFITWIISISIGTANAGTIDTIIRVDQEHQSISAPDGFIHQWYLNGEKIEGATTQDLKIEETGLYKVEITNTLGETTEIENSFLVTAAGAIIKIYIIGDSTVCNYPASDYPWAGWGQIIPAFFNTTNLSFTNNAIGGRSSRSFYLQGRWTPIKNALNPGDYVFIQWGHNDRDFSDTTRYTSVADYKKYITMYCTDVLAKGAIPVLISPMVLNAWTGTTMRNVFTETGNNYRGAMLEVATALNVAFVDLNMKSWNLYKTYGAVYNQHFIYKGFNPGEYPNYPAGVTDGTHFQEMGAICNARMIVQGITELSARPDMANLINNLKPQYTISTSVNPTGKDSMTTKSYTYPQGLTVTLKTVPKTSSTFQKWNNASNTQLSTASLTTVISGSSATSYTAIYAGATTCSATITSSTAITFCAGGSIALTASTGASYKWFNGTTQVGTAASYTATAAGSYTVEVTNAAGCKATSATKVITVNPLPVITPYVQINTGTWTSAATASACETNTVSFGPQPTVATGWSWTGPNNFTSTLRNPVLTNVLVANSGNYIATYTDANGCKATSTLAVQITKPTASITTPATSFCAGGSAVLTANTGSSYKWFNGTIQVGTAATYTATAAGAYTVEVTNTAGCKATSAATQITVNALPTATITAPATSFCTGGSTVLTASAGSSYKWFNGTTQVETAATYTATVAGSYTVEVTNAASCKATSAATQISVSALPTASITAPATSFCAGGSALLSASAGTSYKWFNGTTQVGTAATYTATTAGSYTVEITNASGCKATSAVTQIAVNALPTATITTPAASFCAGGSALLSASAGTSYKWFNGTTQVGTAATYTATTAGAYTVEVTNASGCKATSAATQISISALPTASITAPATSFCTGGSALLSASAGASYKWFNGTIQVGTSATYTASAAGAYTVEVTNAAGCKATSAATQISVSAALIWYQDLDNDGKGNATITLTACTQPAGYVSVAGDACPTDPNKINAGACGCGNLETDTDNDGTPDCTDSDDDNDGSADANDCAPLNASIGAQTIWYEDADGDGTGNTAISLTACTQPTGYVSTSGDACPTDANKTATGYCGCENTEASCLDCAGTPNGTAFHDNCSICVGGTTGNTACLSTATINGTTENIKVMPQPFDLNTTIRLENQGNIQSVTIFNASGALVQTVDNLNTQEIIVGDDLASGLYSVIIRSNNGIRVTKIIKK